MDLNTRTSRFEALFDRHHGDVERYIRRRSATGGSVDDAVAETFLVARVGRQRGLTRGSMTATAVRFRVTCLVESSVMPAPRRRSRSLPGHLPQAGPGEVLVWTDGACQRNPGPGGWAALVCWEDGVVEEHSGGLPQTTNNIMEMTAALEGMRALPSGSRACIVTDSRYLHDGMTSWMAGWERRNWRTAGGDPVKNKELWTELAAAAATHEQVRWHWIKGHIGHDLNERADQLAVAAIREVSRSAA